MEWCAAERRSRLGPVVLGGAGSVEFGFGGQVVGRRVPSC